MELEVLVMQQTKKQCFIRYTVVSLLFRLQHTSTSKCVGGPVCAPSTVPDRSFYLVLNFSNYHTLKLPTTE